MDLIQALGTLMSFTAFGMVGAGVMKAFHIANDLGEVKELLRDVRRALEDQSQGKAGQVLARGRDQVIRGLDEDDYAAAIHAQALRDSLNAESQPAPSQITRD